MSGQTVQGAETTPIVCIKCRRTYQYLHVAPVSEGSYIPGLCPEHVGDMEARLFGSRRPTVPVSAQFDIEVNR